MASVVEKQILSNKLFMISIYPQNISSPDTSDGLSNHYLSAALLASAVLHGIVLLLLYQFSAENHLPKPEIKKIISLTLVAPISPATHQSEPPLDPVTTKGPETTISSSQVSSIPQPRKPKEASPLQENQPANLILLAPAKKQEFITRQSAIDSECTPLQRKSKIHRCSESNNGKWQSANTNTYQRAFFVAFENAEQRSEFQKDREKIIQLISAQEDIYALTESSGKESESQKQEQLRITQEIDKLLDKNQGILELIEAR